MRVHVVHGIMDPVGSSGLLKIVPYLKAAHFDVRVPDYGLITALETRIVNPIITRCLAPYIEPGDIYVGHSNGCAIGYDLVNAGAPLAGLVLFDAALRRDIVLPTGVWADVYYNAGDDATVAAVVGAKLGLVEPVWGDMGHAGYVGMNRLIASIDCGVDRPISHILPAVSGHSDIFTAGKFEYWMPYAVERILGRAHTMLA